jgi:hypothetical protein
MACEAATGIVHLYAAPWDARDDGERRALLERAWADDAVRRDPTARVEGREALMALDGMDFGELGDDPGRLKRIAGFFGAFPRG